MLARLFAPALILGVVVGWLISMQFVSGGRDGNTTVVNYGIEGAPVTVRTALFVAMPIVVIFILIVKFGLGFDGNLFGLVATIAIPSILTAVAWVLLGSLA